jgi:hypothetical protein
VITPSSLKVFGVAQRLVNEAREGVLVGRQRDVFLQVQNDPRRAAELLIVLAELVAAERPPLVDEALRRHLRKAHAAWFRGERDDWVVEGERAYQRNKKRLYRWRERGAVETKRGAA